jgi:hypothetical protein
MQHVTSWHILSINNYANFPLLRPFNFHFKWRIICDGLDRLMKKIIRDRGYFGDLLAAIRVTKAQGVVRNRQERVAFDQAELQLSIFTALGDLMHCGVLQQANRAVLDHLQQLLNGKI